SIDPNLVEIQKVNREVTQRDKIITLLRWFFHAEPFKKLRWHPIPAFRFRLKRLPNEEVGVLLRRNAFAEPVVERCFIIDVTFVIERFGDVSRLLADGPWAWRLLRSNAEDRN